MAFQMVCYCSSTSFFYAFIVLKFLMMILVLKETRPLLLLIDLQRGLEYLL